MYKVLIEKAAQKQLERIPEPDYSRIKKAILDLGENPRPPGFKKLKGRPGYRIRQGDFRIIYIIKDKMLTVFVLETENRKDIYE